VLPRPFPDRDALIELSDPLRRCLSFSTRIHEASSVIQGWRYTGGAMSRLYHAVVVVGAGLSVWSCGNTESADDEAAGGAANEEGGAAAAGPEKGGASGDASAGGSNRGGSVVVTGGAPSTCAGSTLPQQCFTPAQPNPELPPPEVTAQWDCRGRFVGCVELAADGGCPPTFGISEPCPQDPSRPTTAADCSDDQVFECLLATLDNDTPVIVNCLCSAAGQTFRTSCLDVEYKYDAPVVDCSEGRKLCGCAYSAILVE
jgi:hypothetical protein